LRGKRLADKAASLIPACRPGAGAACIHNRKTISMKKTLALSFVAAAALGLAACSSQTNNEVAASADNASAEVAATSSEAVNDVSAAADEAGNTLSESADTAGNVLSNAGDTIENAAENTL
jgi:hypothetical protein